MKNNNLSDIVRVDIDIEKPVVNSSSFDHILIVGPEPASWSGLSDEEHEKKDSVFICSGASELSDKDSLFAATDEFFGDPIGIAGRVAFSQDPKPDKVYFAVNKKLPATIKDCNVIVANTNEEIPADLLSELGEENVTGLPWIIGSCGFNIEVDDPKKRKTAVSLSKGTGIYDDDTVVSSEVNGVNYICIPVGSDIAGKYSIRIEDTIYSSQEKVDENIVNQTNCTVNFEVDESGKIDNNTYSRKYEYACEDIVDTLERALLTNGWYVICPAYTDKTTLEKIGSWTDSQTKTCLYSVVDVPEGDDNPICDKSLRCSGMFAKESFDQKAESVPKDNIYINVAWSVKCLNYQAGSETWALKTLVGIQPACLSSTQMRKLEELNINYYTTYADRDVTCIGKNTYGEWIDLVRFRDWLQNEIQIDIFSLMVTNPKIPFTDEGINLVHNVLISALKRGQKRGGIAPDEYDSDNNLILGFVTSVPRASDITPSQKASRKLSDVTFSARIAGAIHMTDINGSLTYTFK